VICQIYDTLRGVRGRLFVVIKLNFFHDMNPFKESSAGVPIYGRTFISFYLLSLNPR
jgi:hypothetical protein